MRHVLANIFWLANKEVRSMLRDHALVGLVIDSFSLAIYGQPQGTTGELHAAAMGICRPGSLATVARHRQRFPAAPFPARRAGGGQDVDRHVHPRHPTALRA